MESPKIQNTKESDQIGVDTSSMEKIAERMPLKRILKTMGISALVSFFIVELIFQYFLARGVSRFPENLIVCLLVLSVGLELELLFLSSETAFLTAFTSVFALISIIGYIFGSSTNPSILGNYFDISGKDRIVMDYLFIGLVGTSVWIIFLLTVYDLLKQVRKLSVRRAYLLLSTSPARIGNFFDKHPWIARILIGIIILVVGILIGTKG